MTARRFGVARDRTTRFMMVSRGFRIARHASMSTSNCTSITSCLALALALAAGCAEQAEPAPELPAAAAAVTDEGAARFLANALERNAIDESYTYRVAAPDGHDGEPDPSASMRTIGVSNTTGLPATQMTPASLTVSWCTPASPTVAVSKSIWCQSCNRNDAEACAAAWANTTAIDYCTPRISSSAGDAACDPAVYTDDICVDDNASGVTSSVQVGSDTACGTWPFRHAAWKVTYRVAGDCGYFCRSEI